MNTANDIKDVVREKYGEAARRVGTGAKGGCCGTQHELRHRSDHVEPLRRRESGEIPVDALAASLGCGNPTALAELRPARRCWTSAPAAASTCCSRRDASGRPAWRTAST